MVFATGDNWISTIFIRLLQFFPLKSLSCIYLDCINAASILVALIVQYQPLMLAGPQNVSRILLGGRQGSDKLSLTNMGTEDDAEKHSGPLCRAFGALCQLLYFRAAAVQRVRE